MSGARTFAGSSFWVFQHANVIEASTGHTFVMVNEVHKAYLRTSHAHRKSTMQIIDENGESIANRFSFWLFI